MEKSGMQPCTVCVYYTICKGERRSDIPSTDCCIPEQPLRDIQKDKSDTNLWIFKTKQYLMYIKKDSTYWTNELSKSNN